MRIPGHVKRAEDGMQDHPANGNSVDRIAAGDKALAQAAYQFGQVGLFQPLLAGEAIIELGRTAIIIHGVDILPIQEAELHAQTL